MFILPHFQTLENSTFHSFEHRMIILTNNCCGEGEVYTLHLGLLSLMLFSLQASFLLMAKQMNRKSFNLTITGKLCFLFLLPRSYHLGEEAPLVPLSSGSSLASAEMSFSLPTLRGSFTSDTDHSGLCQAGTHC